MTGFISPRNLPVKVPILRLLMRWNGWSIPRWWQLKYVLLSSRKLAKRSNLTNLFFQRDWNHQLDTLWFGPSRTTQLTSHRLHHGFWSCAEMQKGSRCFKCPSNAWKWEKGGHAGKKWNKSRFNPHKQRIFKSIMMLRFEIEINV